MGAFCININGIEGLACSHEQAIAFGATKADIRADFWKKNLADANAIGRKDMHAIVAFTHPTCAGPDVPLGIAADTIRKACDFLAIEFKGHRGELSCGTKFFAIKDVEHPDILGRFIIVRCPRICDIKLFVIGGET